MLSELDASIAAFKAKGDAMMMAMVDKLNRGSDPTSKQKATREQVTGLAYAIKG